MYPNITTTQQYINVTQEKRLPSLLTHKQIILLYLKYENPIVNYKDFIKVHSMKYDTFNKYINILLKQNIIKLKKKGKPNTFKLNISPNKLKIFNHAANKQKNNNPKLIDIINNTKFSTKPNIHNLHLTAHFDGLYQELKIFENPLDRNNSPIVKRYKYEFNTFITVIVYTCDLLVITIACSENPILTNDTKRLDKILSFAINKLNQRIPNNQYNFNYNAFTVTKHDLAVDGIISYSLPKGYQIKYTNKDNQELFLYVKESYEYSSWIRIEDRANNEQYILPQFQKIIKSKQPEINPL